MSTLSGALSHTFKVSQSHQAVGKIVSASVSFVSESLVSWSSAWLQSPPPAGDMRSLLFPGTQAPRQPPPGPRAPPALPSHPKSWVGVGPRGLLAAGRVHMRSSAHWKSAFCLVFIFVLFAPVKRLSYLTRRELSPRGLAVRDCRRARAKEPLAPQRPWAARRCQGGASSVLSSHSSGVTPPGQDAPAGLVHSSLPPISKGCARSPTALGAALTLSTVLAVGPQRTGAGSAR